MTPTGQAKRARVAMPGGGRVVSAWRRADRPGLLHEVGVAGAQWARLTRAEAERALERVRLGWAATQNPALLLSALEGGQVLGVCPAWMAEAAHAAIAAGFGEGRISRGGKPSTLAAWWRRHQQDVIDVERYAMFAELRDRFALTWDDAAAVTARVWLGGIVGAEAVKASCRRVRREIRAGRAARYYWTPADERSLRTLKANPLHVRSLVAACEELDRVLARRGKTRDDYYGHDSGESW
jgi:hypothetical protein